MHNFLPEGSRLGQLENSYYTKNLNTLEEARQQKKILEGRAIICDAHHNLIIDLGFTRGIIYHSEGALGIDTGETRDIAIISKVNKPVCFVVTGFQQLDNKEIQPILSRKEAQTMCKEEYLSGLVPGDVIQGKVTHMESFGAFIDIGCGMPSLIPIDQISVSRIAHPKDRFSIGDMIYAVVKSSQHSETDDKRICLSHKELLGSWEENIALFHSGETVAGIIRSVEDYGVFVELSPNLAGLAEPFEGAQVGKHASVYIKSIIREKMKIKLVLVDAFDAEYAPSPIKYFMTQGHIDRWVYSSSTATKLMETVF